MEEKPMPSTRRDFLKTSFAGVSALTILPSSVIAGLGKPLPSDKLNIAAVGVGGIGFRNLTNLERENIVALCDVDWDYGQKAFRRWSTAARYRDFRVMLENEKNIDAVLVATPDHTHSVVAMAAMQLQKHVFVQAPMAHSVFEVRRMVETARVFDLVTQVGNQAASSDETREIAEILWEGTIGEVTEVHAWTSKPNWKQGGYYPEGRSRIPKELDWDLFLGPSSEIPYNPAYTPYTWRGWWNFSNGTAGTIGPHLLEPVFRALKLQSPIEVEASSTPVNLQSAPQAQKLVFSFDRRDNMPRLAMPPVKLFWYDGGLKPDLPDQVAILGKVGNDEGGIIFIGSNGILVCSSEGKDYSVIVKGNLLNVNAPRQLHRIANPYTGGHENDWVRSCKESGNNRLLPAASFATQAALTETLLVGSLAVRMQSLGKKLLWDSPQMRFTNINNYEEFSITRQGEPYIQNGLPRFDVDVSKHNASHFVDQTVRPLYRQGWQQI
jgi:hypothetical protein